MKHYRRIKKISLSITILSILLVAVNASSLFFLNKNQTRHSRAQAPDYCGEDNKPRAEFFINGRLIEDGQNIEPDTKVDIRISYTAPTDSSGNILATHFFYRVFVQKMDDWENPVEKTYGKINQQSQEENRSFIIESAGERRIYATFQKVLDDDLTLRSCAKNLFYEPDPPITLLVGVGGVNQSLSLTVPGRIKQGDNVDIKIQAKNFSVNNRLKIRISTGESGCGANTEELRCWKVQHEAGIQDPSDYQFPIPWDTKSDTNSISKIGDHIVQTKIINDQNVVIAQQEKTVNICDPATGPACQTGGGGGSGGGGSVDEPIEVPKEIEVSVRGNKSWIKLPTTITGIGDLIAIILRLLIYIIGILAFFSVVVGGFQYITSGGDSSKAEKAKKTLIYSVIGIVLASLALSLTFIIGRFWDGP